MACAGQAKYRPYPVYKPSGVEWLGDIPEGWKRSYLGFECSVKARLGWKGLKADEYVDDGFIFLATPNIKNEAIDFKNVNFITEKRYAESPEIALKVGDVLVTKDGSTTGTSNVVRSLPRPATVNSSIAVLRSDGELNSVFLYYFFLSEFTQSVINRVRGGMGVPHLFQADLRKFDLLLPPLPEQSKISAFLDHETAKIDALIAKQERLIELLEEKRQAVISHAVTKGLNPDAPLRPSGIDFLGDVPAHWQVTRLKHVAAIFGRIGFRGYTVDDIVDEGDGALVLSPSNIIEGNFSLEKRSYLSWKKYEESPEIIVRSGDILLVKTGSTFGKSTFIKCVTEPMTINPQMALLKIDARLAEFTSFYIKSALIRAFIDISNTGSGMPTMTQENMGSFPILIPPASETKEIVDYLAKHIKSFDLLVNKAFSAVTLLKERRAAVISAAVTGKIDVRDWQPPKHSSDHEFEEKAFA